MSISVKISDDLVECLDDIMEEQELSSYSSAVDYVLSDYFDLLESPESEE